LPAFNINSTNY